MSTPDVSVIVAVYNTMPYLTDCLDSLVHQSIGRDKVEVIAVDDGSTDEGGAELERYAARFPDTVTVIHQANSGGPAAPSNRGLEVATGRYVFFIGADDYLGPQALERLVDAADRWGSDVIFGKMVGANGRRIPQTMFATTEQDVDLYDSELPFALSNTKLFRRDLVEKYQLRYPEDLPIGSDQPFTVEALVRAKRVSVLSDYTFYYAVKRTDSSNISFSSSFSERIRCTAAIMDFIADLVEAGPRRDAILRRHFSWGVARLLREDFLDLNEKDQKQLCNSVRQVADDYFTEGVQRRLSVWPRLRIKLAQEGDLARLREVIRHRAVKRPHPLVSDGERIFVKYPELLEVGLNDDFYVVDHGDVATLAKGTFAATVSRLQSGGLHLEARIAITGTYGPPHAELVLIPVAELTSTPGVRTYPAPGDPAGVIDVDVRVCADGDMSEFTADIEPLALLVDESADVVHRALRLRVRLAHLVLELPLPAPSDQRSVRLRSGLRFYKLKVLEGKSRLVITQSAVPLKSVVQAHVRRLPTSLGRPK